MKPTNINFKSLQTGISLLEVLVALFVLAVGLLGVIALQAESIKLNQQAYGSTQAIFVANDAAERMRVNVLALSKEDQAALTKDKAFPDLAAWQATVQQRVPGGSGAVDLLSGSTFRITITYPQQSLANENKAVDAEDVTYVLFASL